MFDFVNFDPDSIPEWLIYMVDLECGVISGYLPFYPQGISLIFVPVAHFLEQE